MTAIVFFNSKVLIWHFTLHVNGRLNGPSPSLHRNQELKYGATQQDSSASLRFEAKMTGSSKQQTHRTGLSGIMRQTSANSLERMIPPTRVPLSKIHSLGEAFTVNAKLALEVCYYKNKNNHTPKLIIFKKQRKNQTTNKNGTVTSLQVLLLSSIPQSC